MAQRIIEMIIGRLITDEQFRSEFLDDPEETLLGLRERGLELSTTEVAALVNTDPAVWERTADALDPRLQKVSLKNNGGTRGCTPRSHRSISSRPAMNRVREARLIIAPG